MGGIRQLKLTWHSSSAQIQNILPRFLNLVTFSFTCEFLRVFWLRLSFLASRLFRSVLLLFHVTLTGIGLTSKHADTERFDPDRNICKFVCMSGHQTCEHLQYHYLPFKVPRISADPPHTLSSTQRDLSPLKFYPIYSNLTSHP